MNNDGYVDLVTSDGENNLDVYYSTLSKVNLLSTVYTPTGSNFSMDYSLSECSQKSPSRNWQLASVAMYDGHTGDGASNTLTTFEYTNPYYDRFERTSFGCENVITRSHDTRNNNAVYRTVTEAYHNTDYLFKGIKKYEVLKDASGKKYVETVYTYKHKRISTGEEVPDSMLRCFGDYYPAISVEDKYFYEGEANYSIHAQKRYTHGKFGNVVEYQNLGDTADASDNVKAVIMYDSIPSIHVMALAKNISVYYGSDLLRSRNADYDNMGRLTSITLNHDGETTVSTYAYNNDGNIATVTQPEDYNGDRKVINIVYDTILKTYPISVTDESSFSSSTDYDYKFGKPLRTTDISGNYINYNYYPDGRLKSIVSPYEKENGIPYTIKFEYWDNHSHAWGDVDNVPWARTLHYDPANGNNLISTVLFSDGLGRAIQTKKKSVVNNITMMVVSGKVSYDAFGRADSTWYPITEGLNSDSIFNPNIDTQNPSITTYDVLDRAIVSVAPDQTTTNISYGFGSDKYGALRFKTSQTDALGNITQQFKDVRGLQTTLIDALNGYTSFIYSPLGELLSSTDPEENTTTHQYDQLGRKIQTTHPDAGTSNFVYDNANNLISMQTQNLINESKQINYVYRYNKLIEIHYPNYPQNDVYYEYGDHHAENNAGRIIKQQDASGVQTFEYGKLGELIKNIHTFVVPGGETYTFAMNWTYDSWNRIQEMTYPDGEVIKYTYNLGGQLNTVTGTKTTNSYNYINSIKSDKFGNRLKIEYGNGTYANYTYNPTTLRLSNLTSYNSQDEEMQNINYTYDDVSNITQINNSATAMSNGLGGSSVYNYSYDKLYRLYHAAGQWGNNNNFSLTMKYSASGNITNKTQYAQTTINGSAVTINYNRDYNYGGSQPHAITNINGGKLGFVWDANGNMTKYSNDAEKTHRTQCWDEENRLIAVKDEKYLSNYLYDAAGERVWKLGGKVQQMLINNEQTVDFVDMNENKTLYANPYMVVNDREYTKHYYIEGQRIASKIGGGLAPSVVPYTSRIQPLVANYDSIQSGLLNHCYSANSCADFLSETTSYGQSFLSIKKCADADYEEPDRYFYHSDHIGSSSFITDNKGKASQHLQYLPFGELFVEQRSTANYYTPYKFSGKEKDEETSYSYFGARYYMSDVSVWLSVDPMRDKYSNISPYAYCNWNPINLIDPNGMEWGEPGNDKKQASDTKTAQGFYNVAELYKKQFISDYDNKQEQINKLDVNSKNYKTNLAGLKEQQSEAMAGVTAMQGIMDDITAAGNDKNNWFTFNPQNEESINLGLSAKKDENGNVIYSIDYAKGKGYGQAFHELSHAGEVANGDAGAVFNGAKFDHYELKGNNNQYFSEKSAYTKQFFAGPLSMPNGPVNSSTGINKQYLMGIKNKNGTSVYTDIK